jgi:hypothetical protein
VQSLQCVTKADQTVLDILRATYPENKIQNGCAAAAALGNDVVLDTEMAGFWHQGLYSTPYGARRTVQSTQRTAILRHSSLHGKVAKLKRTIGDLAVSLFGTHSTVLGFTPWARGGGWVWFALQP